MYQEGTDLRDKKIADFCFKMNMYMLIKHKGFSGGYRWKMLESARKKLADIYFNIVSVYGERAFFRDKI